MPLGMSLSARAEEPLQYRTERLRLFAVHPLTEGDLEMIIILRVIVFLYSS